MIIFYDFLVPTLFSYDSFLRFRRTQSLKSEASTFMMQLSFEIRLATSVKETAIVGVESGDVGG
jgi:hypothetical protein